MSVVQEPFLHEESDGQIKEMQSGTDSQGYKQLKGKYLKGQPMSRNDLKLTNRFEILTESKEIQLQTDET